HRTAALLRSELPGIELEPVIAALGDAFELPGPGRAVRRTLVFFPGRAIGHFEPGDARRFLARLTELAGDDRMLLLGADAARDPDVLLRAYDDESGATAAFHRNMLLHLNQTHGATFE